MLTYALAALADPTRRRVFELVAQRPRAVGELAGELPVSRPAVSQHLKVLRGAGLVSETRNGTRHVYYLDRGGLAALRSYFDRFWEESLDAFKGALEARPLVGTDGEPQQPQQRIAGNEEEQ